MSITAVFVIIYVIMTSESAASQKFPKEFMFGTATSAYQVEGGWNASGKGVNIWDQFTHDHPESIIDGSNGDVACDSYHKLDEDVALLKNLGVQFYRFSLSWSRILPNGYVNHVNPDGIRYYNELIDKLVKNNIMPMVNLYHWDLPVSLQGIGGWANPLLADIFTDYADFAFATFGDRVPYWITFNTDHRGYDGDVIPPRLNQSGIANYLCGHTTIIAHAKTYRMYQRKYKKSQKGEIGIVSLGVNWYEPKTDSEADIEATTRAREFELGYYTNPILGNGDYPKILKERVAYRSMLEGFSKSRLPEFTAEEKKYINGSYDFLAVNIYTSNLVNDIPEAALTEIGQMSDLRVQFSFDDSWKNTSVAWLKVVPDSIRNILKWYKKRFNNPKIVITENGCPDEEEFEDYNRISYHEKYLSELLNAIHKDKVNVVGYTAWSLLDNFEWNDGYTQRFGLYHVNFNDSNRTRTPKLSAEFYKKVIAERRLNFKP